MKIHHIGYAVKSIEKSLRTFQLLGFEIEGNVIHDEKRNVKLQFIRNNDIRFELVEPISTNSPVSKLLNKNGSIPYHFCLVSNNIDSTIKKLRRQGFVLLNKKETAPAIDNRNVAFLFHKEIGLIELLED
jgi:methylmalonyl-CoA/ethylmalonyl-CoA epimerase